MHRDSPRQGHELGTAGSETGVPSTCHTCRRYKVLPWCSCAGLPHGGGASRREKRGEPWPNSEASPNSKRGTPRPCASLLWCLRPLGELSPRRTTTEPKWSGGLPGLTHFRGTSGSRLGLCRGQRGGSVLLSRAPQSSATSHRGCERGAGGNPIPRSSSVRIANY